jgi:surface antigen Omp85-like protein
MMPIPRWLLSRRWLWTATVVALLCGKPVAYAQEVTTRTEEIERARRQKQAILWPERESPLVARANGLLDRGLGEGIQSGEGNNGWQLVLTGTRANQGQTFGIGYRRSDLFRDTLTARAAVAGTLAGAFLVEGEGELNSLRRSADTFVTLYGKYERSPHMEFYGLGSRSRQEERSRYLLNTLSGELRAGYRFTRDFNIGVELLGGGVHTGPSSGDDVPSIETIFNARTAPGLFDDTTFLGYGGFAGYDTRDVPRGPRRGGFYGINFTRYVDMSGGRYTNRQLELEGQQFLPYFNATRVVALFARAKFAYTGQDARVVPFYLLAKLGGNFDLRGFGPYRFHDNNALFVAVEHRWYAFAGLEMALFVGAGKTVPEKRDIFRSEMNYSGGIGFRARVNDAIVLRFDIARSREGLRWIWSMSDISRRRF